MQTTMNRRAALRQCGLGMGALALSRLLAASGFTDPMAPRQPQFPAKAKRVIHIFANGGPSQIDTFDPKPALNRFHGKPLPVSERLAKTESRTGAALRSPFEFARHGQSGAEVSELFPHLAKWVDEISIVRSMQTDTPNHEQALMMMNTGASRLMRPSVGSWITYGLGTENQNLPGFVVMCPRGVPPLGPQNWQSVFLPGVYQGNYVDTGQEDPERLIKHVRNHRLSSRAQRRQLDLLLEMNQQHSRARQDDAGLEARLQSFELAYRMQMEATDAFDVHREPQHVRDAYGPGAVARSMLIGRRLLERGVRFVQLWHGNDNPWDSHEDLEVMHRKLALESDRALAALLGDLKERGLLDETLVIWGGEFGRTPTVQLADEGLFGKRNGRDHNHWGFTVWLAGGGVKPGYVHGETDEFGFEAVKDPVHVHDLHATILWLLGFDHQKLTFRYAGRDFRLTDVHGRVVTDLIA